MAQFNKNTADFLEQHKTLFETVMLADKYGNIVGAANPSGAAVDAFGRARISQPITLFDSFSRYQDNGKWSTATSGTASEAYDVNSSTVLMNVDVGAGDQVFRETNRVFFYEPGKSLQILMTFDFAAEKTNLRQRIGYFDTLNGVFLQHNDDVTSFVIRSYSTGSLNEDIVIQDNWNLDKLDGTGPSKKTLDISKAQIMFIDIEWLGVGSVRCGFVIDGQLINCHTFHHANITNSTYMTTAILPLRAEITNTGITASPSSMRFSCATVISEGGYEVRGRPRSVGNAVTTPKDMPVAGTFVPIMSLRLKANRLNAIVLPKDISLVGVGNNSRISYRLVVGNTLTGAVWTSAGADSNVEYDLTATALTGGTTLSSGYVSVAVHGSQTINIDRDTFRYQLERQPFTSTPTILTLAATSSAAGDDALASIDWEEV